MISIDEARSRILRGPGQNTPVSLAGAEAVGLVLAQPAASDIDSPPHDKALVDGYAVRSADVQRRGVELEVVERIVAGQVPTRSCASGDRGADHDGRAAPRGCRCGGDGRADAAFGRLDRPCGSVLRRTGAGGQHIMRRGAVRAVVARPCSKRGGLCGPSMWDSCARWVVRRCGPAAAARGRARHRE